MNIKVVEDASLDENEIIITCSKRNAIIDQIVDELNQFTLIASHRGNQFPLNLQDILFFETEGDSVYAHLRHAAYTTQYRLYELENVLPGNFIRIAKSTIVNTAHIESIEKGIATSRCVTFNDSHKVVYVSRMYYPVLRNKLKERSLFK